ncbi:hypothetical protein AX769_00350 [Frondihabitans sp. PAMC 28766]|uniref:winged helix DNA-binding domain-containing protein n=1 Tax=Frondihabitans sp. PAMC 28766 TaxID=1795630 RepID=UPI00078BCE15|nr:winged helix DNA-binding domain-containing protein [Frondihabitans sp. PAMC 28766]AMM18872.1 hypothetical protein AX769_00350 [Frondihabitans sp. PAMC 28766]
MRDVTAGQRRALVTRRHHLAGDATGPDEVARCLVGLHATDPATPYLSVLARGHGATIDDVQTAMYERRSLVRWMAMRRTLFVFPVETVPVVQAAASRPLAATLRRQLVNRLARNGSVPPVEGDIGEWIESVGEGAHAALVELGSATGAQLGAAEPRLRTLIPPRAKSDLPQNVTASLLVVMSCEARMVRGTATGAWTARQHRWEPLERWWPSGLPDLGTPDAQVALVRAWLEAFGPAPVSDIEWWTGWTKAGVRAALNGLPLAEVSLDGAPGVMLDEPLAHRGLDEAAIEAAAGSGADAPVVTLLPALDPTPMGYKTRDWFTAVDLALLYDRNGNLGPTLWCDGEIVGGWAIAPGGEVRVRVVAERGAAVAEAASRAAAALQARLGGATVTPVFRTALERALTA